MGHLRPRGAVDFSVLSRFADFAVAGIADSAKHEVQALGEEDTGR